MRPRRPTAFSLDEVRYEPEDLYPPEPEPGDLATLEPAASAPSAAGHKSRWLGLFFLALGGLIVLAIGIAVDNLVSDLFHRNDWLGWLAVVLVVLAGLAVLAMAARETAALLRLRRINHIHARAAAAAEADDRAKALSVVAELEALYRRRPETARGRAELTRHRGEIIDGRDLLGLAETHLLLPFDETARRMILASAKRVAVVTAISPRALVDLLFVGSEIIRLIRRLATLYGGRPGTIGFFRLARATVAHLAVTGGIAAGDSLVQQILGHGIAARLSARLGEGVVNGLLTARVGIAAIEVCRPLPFLNGRPPRLADVMAALRPLGGGKDSADGKAIS
ncbi:MAG: TIGR01620 family protein [Bauldia sp.]